MQQIAYSNIGEPSCPQVHQIDTKHDRGSWRRQNTNLCDDHVNDRSVVPHADMLEEPGKNLLLQGRSVILLRHPASHHYPRQRRCRRHTVLLPHVHAAEHLPIRV